MCAEILGRFSYPVILKKKKIIPNPCDQLVFSWKHLAFYKWLSWMLLGLFGVLAGVGVVIHRVWMLHKWISGTGETTERWSNPEEVRPRDDAGSCLVGSRLFKRLASLTMDVALDRVRGWGKMQQLTQKNLKHSSEVWGNRYSRASAGCLWEQSTDLLPRARLGR